MIAQRWTGLVEANERGGFVAYGDYQALKAENERLRGALNAICSRLPQPDEFAYPNYFAKVELENARSAMKGQP